MLTFTGKGRTSTCDGVTRRDFLQAGTLGAIGFGLPQWFAAQAAGAVKPGRRRPRVHHDLQPRRTEQHGPLGHEARRARRGAGTVQADRDRVAGDPVLRDPAAARQDRRQALARAVGPSQRRGGARCGLADDADRPAVHRRRQHAAHRVGGQLSRRAEDRPAAVRRAARADGPRRRQLAQRAGRRLSGQGTRPVLAQRRPVPAWLPRARPPAAQGDRQRPPRPPAQDPRARRRRGRHLRGFRERRASRWKLPVGIPADDKHAGARGVRPGPGTDERLASDTACPASASAACSRGGWSRAVCGS